MNDSRSATVDDARFSAPGLHSMDDAELTTSRDKNGLLIDVHRYLGATKETPGGPGGRPQAFLVHSPPGCRLDPHFHRVDQFQVFFGAEGATYQRGPIPKGTVVAQYADAYRPYGPIVAGSQTLDYFTLRGFGDGFTAYMPEGRDRQIHKGERLLKHTLVPAEFDAIADGQVQIEEVFGGEADHLACLLIRAGRAAAFTGPSPTSSNGQFYCVIDGEVTWNDHVYGPKSLAFVGPEDLPLDLTTGDHSCAVLVMQLPNPASFPHPPSSDSSPTTS